MTDPIQPRGKAIDVNKRVEPKVTPEEEERIINDAIKRADREGWDAIKDALEADRE